VLFAGILLFVAGFINVIEGLVALVDKSYYVVTPSGLAVQVDYSVWGWVLVAVGVLMAIAGYGVLVGQTWARVFGVVVAVINAIVNFAFVAAAPGWTVLAITLNVVLIYALLVHGREARIFRGG
jgi:hypothetical protein